MIYVFVFSIEVGPVGWEESGYFTFDGTEKASGVTAGPKGLKKGPCSLLYMVRERTNTVKADKLGFDNRTKSGPVGGLGTRRLLQTALTLPVLPRRRLGGVASLEIRVRPVSRHPQRARPFDLA